jgi:hypothetical protein
MFITKCGLTRQRSRGLELATAMGTVMGTGCCGDAKAATHHFDCILNGHSRAMRHDHDTATKAWTTLGGSLAVMALQPVGCCPIILTFVILSEGDYILRPAAPTSGGRSARACGSVGWCKVQVDDVYHSLKHTKMSPSLGHTGRSSGAAH